MIPGIAISLFFGMIKYNPRDHVITFSGALVQASIWGIIGWQFRNFYLNIRELLSIDNLILVILIAVVILQIRIKRDK